MKKILSIALAFALYIPVAHAASDAVPYTPINTHIVTIAGTSAATTTPTSLYVDVIRVVCTVDCYVAIAASGQGVYAATPSVSETTSVYLPANVPEYFRIGSQSKIAVIQVTSGGSLIVTEMSK